MSLEPEQGPIDLLSLFRLNAAQQRRIEDAGFRVHPVPDLGQVEQAILEVGPDIRAVLTTGSTGFSAARIKALPRLEIISAIGAGFERIDLAAARQRGIVVTHGRGANTDSVADHAMALLLAAVRGLRAADLAVRKGVWADYRDWFPSVSGRRLGVLGFGGIGKAIAKRGAGGFGMDIGYHARSAVEDSGFSYFEDSIALARWADFLVVALPGGAETRHMVGTAMLQALGPQGFLVNVGRGSVVDNDALAAALHKGVIAGAALDVLDGEPDVPDALLSLPNVLLTPHIAGRSPQAGEKMLEQVLANLTAHFAGQPVLTPVTE